jgi:hypothetical protein
MASIILKAFLYSLKAMEQSLLYSYTLTLGVKLYGPNK